MEGISKARDLTLCDGSEKASWRPRHVSWAWREKRRKVPKGKEWSEQKGRGEYSEHLKAPEGIGSGHLDQPSLALAKALN